MQLSFDRGTLLLEAAPERSLDLPGFLWDPRVGAWRAPGYMYRAVRGAIKAACRQVTDSVRPAPGDVPEFSAPSLRPYQEAALLAWQAGGRRGVVALPTGAGKTRTAIAAIAGVAAPTLCLVPTRILLKQWVRALEAATGRSVGQLGDGHRRLASLTVATYASGMIQAERIGNRFDLLVVDEVHHFGSPGSTLLELFTAPLRLGLTATPGTDPVRLDRLRQLVGPVVYQCHVSELVGSWLASLRLVTLTVALNTEERRLYEAERAAFSEAYRNFFDRNPSANWQYFAATMQKSEAGRRAMAGWRRSRAMLGLIEGKRRLLAELLLRHREQRSLIFSPDNTTAYRVARDFGVMPITCDIDARERSEVLQLFAEGKLSCLVSARVLNEGFDVPSAEVGIILGGRQGSQEYVQRVGRLLRPAAGKVAVVYELVGSDTFEVHQVRRGRERLAVR